MNIKITDHEHWEAVRDWLAKRRIHTTLDKLVEGSVGDLQFSNVETIKDNGHKVDPYAY